VRRRWREEPPSGAASVERAAAEVDLGAIAHNAALLRERLCASALLCAVVKAEGYGHGALPAARAALAGGARWLAVATAQEAAQLRAGGLREVPILVMGALCEEEIALALSCSADIVAWREQTLQTLVRAGGGRVHLKLDSGMGRLGSRDPEEVVALARRALELPGVQVAGVMTHFATADEMSDEGYFEQQLAAFRDVASRVKALAPQALAHAANSAALLRERSAHFDMARCGIAIYGMDPFGADAAAQGLRPALTLRTYVAEVKLLRAGEYATYGRRYRAQTDTYIGVLPIGYADGFRRGLSGRGEVLIGGRRSPQVGTVSMDNITVALGSDPSCLQLLGSEAVIIGAQGQERISAEEVAEKLQTINYEVTCAIGARVPRRYVGS